MTWIWLSAMVILIGAELGAEMEQQSARYRHRHPKPMGSWRATMVDPVGARAARPYTWFKVETNAMGLPRCAIALVIGERDDRHRYPIPECSRPKRSLIFRGLVEPYQGFSQIQEQDSLFPGEG